jgi:hypothetical protein
MMFIGYRRSAVSTAAVVLTASLALHAQAADTSRPSDLRKGPYGSIGPAYASAPTKATVNGSSISDTQTGISIYLGAGVALNPHFRVGGEWNHVFVSDLFSAEVGDGQNGSIDFLSAAVTYYPSLTNEFWVKGNLGWSKLQVTGSFTGASTESGFAGGIGAGYDFRLGHSNYVLVPFVNYFTQFSASGLNGYLQNQGNGKVSMFQIGVGFGYHH